MGKVSINISIIIMLLIYTCYGDTIPDRICATLYSNLGYRDKSFKMKDFDQSANAKKDYRSSINGWNETHSIEVSSGCALSVCDKTYFEGNCKVLNSGQYESSNWLILSASCTCTRPCKCSDVVPKNFFSWFHDFGRAYLNRGCNTCNSEYIQLTYESDPIPERYRDAVTNLVIPDVFTINITSFAPSNIFSRPVVEGLAGPIEKYEIECKTEKQCTDYSIPFRLSHVSDYEYRQKMLVQRTSYENGRSSTSVYIIILFDGEFRSYERMSRSIGEIALNFPWCWGLFITDQILECTVNARVSSPGFGLVEIRIVAVPVLKSDVMDDREYQYLARLDEYIYDRRDLKDKTPNLILVQSNLNTTSGEMSFEFRRISKDNYEFLNASVQQNPENVIETIENELQKTYSFPKPIHLIPVVSYPKSDAVNYPKVNGNFRLANREYFPKNFRDQIILLMEKGKDVFGLTIFRDWFEKCQFISLGGRTALDLLSENHFSVAKYRRLAQTLANLREMPIYQSTTETVYPAGENVINIWTYIGITIGITLPMLLLIILAVVWMRYNKRRNILTQQEIKQFLYGNIGKTNDKPVNEINLENGPVERSALAQPYNKSVEISKHQFQICWSSLLGAGAFGCVYKAYISSPHDEAATEVALKMTKDNCPKTAILSILSEIKILTYLGYHPNLVSLKGAYTSEITKGIVYVATELCSLGSLKSYLREAEKSSRAEAGSLINVTTQEMVTWSYEIACGMEYFAEKHVIHADLATRNVLLTETKTVKITDFGLSRRLYDYTNYVKTQQEPLPWRWMAIESLNNLEFSSQSDVWSFGIVLWEIFSMGHVPYPGLSWTLDFVTKLEAGLRMKNPLMATPEIYKLMSLCWEKEPQNRPTFSQLKQSLERIKNSHISTFVPKQLT